MIFAINLVAPRPDFVDSMTDEEKAVMADHVEYWTGLLAGGVAVVFGPVLDPAGPYGLGVVEVESQDQLQGLIVADPAVRSGMTAKAYPMPGAIIRH